MAKCIDCGTTDMTDICKRQENFGYHRVAGLDPAKPNSEFTVRTEPHPDFRTRTCGECAWAGKHFTQKSVSGNRADGERCTYCRRVNWGVHHQGLMLTEESEETPTRLLFETAHGMVFTDTPACPAFVEAKV